MEEKYYLIDTQGVFRYTTSKLSGPTTFGKEKIGAFKSVPEFLIVISKNDKFYELITGQVIMPEAYKHLGNGIYFSDYTIDTEEFYRLIPNNPVLVKEPLDDILFKLYGKYKGNGLEQVKDKLNQFVAKGAKAKFETEEKKKSLNAYYASLDDDSITRKLK